MEAAYSSETPVFPYEATECHNPENHNLNNHCCEKLNIYKFSYTNCLSMCKLIQIMDMVHIHWLLFQQGVTSKSSSSEVEIIRYQVLIPVTEVQVRASSAKDMDSHFLWELIHLRSQLQRRSEKVYVLSNR
jgi:hypothetical protein